MTDRYENIRKALAMLGPGNSTQEQIAALDDLDHACDPDTIRELLAERDALARDAERYRKIRKHCDYLDAVGECLAGWPFYNNGCRALDALVDSLPPSSAPMGGHPKDAAIDQARGKGLVSEPPEVG